MRAAADKFAINILVGFEVEFEIMQRSTDGALVPLSTGLGRYAASGLRDPSFTLVEEAMGILLGSGVGIQTFQTEGRRGQYEISLSPKSPLSAIDEVVLVQDCLKQFFADHGYVLTMSPKPVAGRRQAVGLHTHLSIDPATQEESFLAGLLAELRMLCAFCLPQMLSYDRVQPYLGGEEVAWGTEDRKVPIRKIGPGHWELRCVDATANMYLALAGVLHAGLLGLEQKKALQWHDTALPRVKPFNEPSHLCRSSGIKGTAADKESGASDTSSTQELLPLTLEAALEYLEQQLDNEVADFNTMTQSDIIRHYLELKKYELSRVRQMEPQVMRELLIELF
jgi:glutamine synthetase